MSLRHFEWLVNITKSRAKFNPDKRMNIFANLWILPLWHFFEAYFGCQIYHLDLIMLNIPKDPYFWGRSCWVFRPYKKTQTSPRTTVTPFTNLSIFFPKCRGSSLWNSRNLPLPIAALPRPDAHEALHRWKDPPVRNTSIEDVWWKGW